jgi:hypothetical protein
MANDNPKTLPADFFEKQAKGPSGTPKTLPPDFFAAQDTPDPTKPDPSLKPKIDMQPSFWGGAHPSIEQEKRISQVTPEAFRNMKEIEKGAYEIGGAMIGGGIVEKGKGLLPIIMRMLGTGTGAAIGNVAVSHDPKEALKTGAVYGGLEVGGELALRGTAKAAEKVSPIVKGLMKSKVAQLAEEHAAKAAEAEKAYQKELSSYQESKNKVLEDYKKSLQEHEVASKKASVRQSQVEFKAGAAAQHQNDLAELLHENLTLTDKKIARTLGDEFETVQEAVQFKNPKVDIEPIVKAGIKAREGLLLDDSRTVFDRMMESIEPAPRAEAKIPKQLPAPKLETDSMGVQWAVDPTQPDLRVSIPKRIPANEAMDYAKGKMAEQVKLRAERTAKMEGGEKYKELRRAYTKLNEYLYDSGEMPPDLYKAVKSVRNQIGTQLQSAADSVGLGGKYSKAMREWHDYKDAWHDVSSLAKGGSPIKRILESADPAYVIDQLKGKAGERLIEEIGKYSKYGADKPLAGRLKGFIEQVRAMPASAGEIPKAPERPQIPKAPQRTEIQPFNREAVARQLLIDRIKKTGSAGALAGGGALIYHLLFGKPPQGTTPVP